MAESAKEFVNGFIQAWNSHDVQRILSYYAPDYEEVDVAQAGPERGRENVRRKIIYYLRAFPDLQVSLDELIAEDSRIAMFWTWHGTHKARFMNIPATGKQIAVRGTSLLKMRGGKIRIGLRIWDLAGLLRGIGLLPEL